MNIKKIDLTKLLASSVIAVGLLAATLTAQAADYAFDNKGTHQFIQFRVKHLGFSWLYGRFNDFDGTFSHDADEPEKTKVSVTIDTTSVDTNHAERDGHLRGENYLNTGNFPKATFESTGYDGKVLKGNLTLMGVTKPVDVVVEKIGEGDDPWGNYRAGFEGKAVFKLADFGMKKIPGPKTAEVEMILTVEGIKKK